MNKLLLSFIAAIFAVTSIYAFAEDTAADTGAAPAPAVAPMKRPMDPKMAAAYAKLAKCKLEAKKSGLRGYKIHVFEKACMAKPEHAPVAKGGAATPALAAKDGATTPAATK